MTALKVLAVLLPMLAVAIAWIVIWFIALIGALTRTDLKENKWLWIILIIFLPLIGVIGYCFVENRKKMGIISLVILLGVPFLVGFLYVATIIRQ